MAPVTMALLGVLAYRTIKGKGRLADMIGDGKSQAEDWAVFISGPGAGGVLSGGLNDLLDRFRQSGQSEKAQSWVDVGPNQGSLPKPS